MSVCRPTRGSSIAIAMAIAVSLTGCVVGPDYEPPDAGAPVAFAAAAQATDALDAPAVATTPDTAWWRTLNDAQLVAYVEAALAQNQELAIARARVREARAARRIAGADRLPTLGVGGQAQRAQRSATGGTVGAGLVEVGLAQPISNFYQASFDAGWEIDLFGATARGIEAATARWQAAEEQRRAVLLSVIAEVARNYIELRGAQTRLAIARDNVRIARDTRDQVQVGTESGLAPDLDLARAQTQLARSQSAIPPLRSAIRAAAHRIAVLLGRRPAQLLAELIPADEAGRLPPAPDLVPTGLPSELLRRRPDLRAAERQLAAASADVGVAVARLYPSFSLTGSVGYQSDLFSDAFDAASQIWSIGAGVAWPLFQGDRLRGDITANRARLDQARHRYRQAVLQAWEEVETALVAYAQTELERRHLAAADRAADRAIRRARVLYDTGLADFSTLLDTQAERIAVSDRLAQVETTRLTRLIALYKALGGGWAVAERAANDSLLSKRAGQPRDG